MRLRDGFCPIIPWYHRRKSIGQPAAVRLRKRHAKRQQKEKAEEDFAVERGVDTVVALWREPMIKERCCQDWLTCFYKGYHKKRKGRHIPAFSFSIFSSFFFSCSRFFFAFMYFLWKAASFRRCTHASYFSRYPWKENRSGSASCFLGPVIADIIKKFFSKPPNQPQFISTI